MKRTSVIQTSFGSRRAFRTLRDTIAVLGYLGCLVAPLLSHGAELKPDTVISWNTYLDAARPQMTSPTPFLWVDQNPSGSTVSVVVRFWSRLSGRKTRKRWTPV